MIQRPLGDLKYIVIHHSDTPQNFTVEQIRQIHLALGYSDIGYHYLINDKGLHVGRDIQYSGAHAIGEKGKWINQSPNHYAIGICIIGNFEDNPLPDKLTNETAYNIRRIAGKYGIPLDREHIVGHREVSYTACPGKDTMNKIYKKSGI